MKKVRFSSPSLLFFFPLFICLKAANRRRSFLLPDRMHGDEPRCHLGKVRLRSPAVPNGVSRLLEFSSKRMKGSRSAPLGLRCAPSPNSPFLLSLKCQGGVASPTPRRCPRTLFFSSSSRPPPFSPPRPPLSSTSAPSLAGHRRTQRKETRHPVPSANPTSSSAHGPPAWLPRREKGHRTPPPLSPPRRPGRPPPPGPRTQTQREAQPLPPARKATPVHPKRKATKQQRKSQGPATRAQRRHKSGTATGRKMRSRGMSKNRGLLNPFAQATAAATQLTRLSRKHGNSFICAQAVTTSPTFLLCVSFR